MVVDEAQDFEPSDWMLVEALTSKHALWAFGDARQQFWKDRAVPERMFAAGTRLKLKQQHRNPPEPAAFAMSYVDDRVSCKRPDPTVLRLSLARSDDVLDRVRHELDTLRRGGAQPEDITILSLAGRDKSRLVGSDRLGSHRLARADNPDALDRVIDDAFLDSRASIVRS